jgi:hypothetical protein
MDDIIQNEFDHPKFDANSILVLMPHKFGANA